MQLEVRVYLGMTTPDGGFVYDCEFREFLKEIVDARFEGYTIYRVDGVWKGDEEDSRILEFIIDQFELPKIMEIAKTYKNRFRQEAVLVTRKELLGVQFV